MRKKEIFVREHITSRRPEKEEFKVRLEDNLHRQNIIAVFAAQFLETSNMRARDFRGFGFFKGLWTFTRKSRKTMQKSRFQLPVHYGTINIHLKVVNN